jgi:pimeloyl-ACP methyl ester carboxylesterase
MERLSTRVGGERIAVRLAGPPAGESPYTILYAHGFGSRQDGEKAAFFRRRAVETGRTFCSFDFRGHGESEGALRDLTLSRNLEDFAGVRELLAERGHRRVVLFGSSMGAASACWYAALAPERCLAAAHIAPAVGLAAAMERWAGPERLARWRREGVVRFASERVETDLGWELMADLRRYPLDRLVAIYRTPTLIFQGQLDTSVEWRDVAAFAERAAPGTVELRLFPDGDHRLIDRLEMLWREAAAWFDKQVAATR